VEELHGLFAEVLLVTAKGKEIRAKTLGQRDYLAKIRRNAGTLGEGAPADVTVIDPNLVWTVNVNKFYTKGRHSPFNGRELKGKAVLTVVDGKVVMRDGVIIV